MIVLNVTYRCKPGMRKDFLEMIKREGIDIACQNENGNIKYDYYLPVGNDSELLLVEKWSDAKALTEHGRQPHCVKLVKLKADYVTDTIIEKFEVLE